MQVKMFSNSRIDDLESDVNSWLRCHRAYTIAGITYQVCHGPLGINHYAMVAYEA